MSETMLREMEVATSSVKTAARLCQAVRADLTPATLEKQDKSPVTVADFGAQALICRALADAFPDDPVIAEENAAALREAHNAELRSRVVEQVRNLYPDSEPQQVLTWIDHGGAQTYHPRFWTLDPIDGTKGFLRGDQYAIALALIVEGEPAAAVLGCPAMRAYPHGEADEAGAGLLATAVRGEGAWARPLFEEGPAHPIRVSETSAPSAARFCESMESVHSDQSASADIARQLGVTTQPLRLDSQAKYALVARGGAEIYLRMPTRAGYIEKIWDHAAGALIVREAGGRVSDVSGNPLEFTHGQELEVNRGVIVTNDHLHEPVLQAVRNA